MYGPNGPGGPYDDLGDECMPDDVSMRITSYTQLLRALSNRNIDARLRSEGMLMLERVRKTIRLPPQGELCVVPLANENKTDGPQPPPAKRASAAKAPAKKPTKTPTK